MHTHREQKKKGKDILTGMIKYVQIFGIFVHPYLAEKRSKLQRSRTINSVTCLAKDKENTMSQYGRKEERKAKGLGSTIRYPFV